MDDSLFQVEDPFHRKIELDEQTFIEHIQLNHPDMTSVDEIKSVIESPDTIAEDSIEPERLCYYRIYRRQPSLGMIKVVVAAGSVITAYRVTRFKSGERILWKR